MKEKNVKKGVRELYVLIVLLIYKKEKEVEKKPTDDIRTIKTRNGIRTKRRRI